MPIREAGPGAARVLPATAHIGRVRRRPYRGGIAFLLLVVFAQRAEAAGYALREQSASAMGNAFAGAAAGADDLSYMFFNPAALSRQSGNQLIVGGSVIYPQIRMHDVEGATSGGVPISGNQGGRNAADGAVVPTVYGLLDLQQAFDLQENIKLGLGVNVPFGVETDYRDGWVGRYYALHSKVMAIDVNPAVAWEVAPGLSVAAGLQVQYVEAKLSNAVDRGTIFGGMPGQQDGHAKLDGNDLGYGYTLGILWEASPSTRFGAGYRSAVHHTIQGDAKFEPGAASGLFSDTGASTKLTTPASVSFGVHHDLTPDVAVMANAEWTQWSCYRNLKIKYDNPAQPDTITENDWRDTWFLALGATWRADEAWTLRGGVAWDQDPTNDAHRTPRIPTDNRWWLSIGAGWTPMENLSLDAGYTHVFFENASIDLEPSGTGNQVRGSLSGNVEGDVDILSIQLRWTF